MDKLNRVLILVGLLVICFSSYSEDTTVQKQDTAKIEPGLPIECTQVIDIGGTIARLVVDSKGNIYVNGVYGACNMTIFNPMGEEEGSFGLQDLRSPPPYEYNLSPVTGVDIDLDDNIYLCNGGHMTIEKFTDAGDFLKKIVLPKSPKEEWYGIRGLAVDEDGTIYTSPYFKFVYIFDKDGKFLKKWTKSGNENDQYCRLYAVAVDRYKKSKLKRIYLGDHYGCRVYVFSKDSKINKDGRKPLFSFGNRGSGCGEMLSISDLEVDSEGYIYVLDRNLGYCSVFNTEGKFMFRFGREEGGKKFLYFPVGMFIDQNDKIYISNSDKGCILVYEWKQERKKF